jgi:WD40 repeat protein
MVVRCGSENSHASGMVLSIRDPNQSADPKTVDLSLKCPGEISLELALSRYSPGSVLLFSALLRTELEFGAPIVHAPVVLAPECALVQWDLDDAIDPHQTCDLKKPFGPPKSVPGMTNHDGAARLTNDELTMYFVWNAGYSPDIYSATRSSLNDVFSKRMNLAELNTPAWDVSPSITGSGLKSYLETNRSGNFQVYWSSRSSATAAWSRPTELPLGSMEAGGPFVAEGGNALYYHAVGDGLDIYRADLEISSDARGLPVDGVNSSFTDANPIVTPDELTMFFTSDRPHNGGGGGDIWIAHRDTITTGFYPPNSLDELNTKDDEAPSWISLDGCRLYFDRSNLAGTQAYVAARPPRVPVN